MTKHTREYYEEIIAKAEAGIKALEDNEFPREKDEYWMITPAGNVVDEGWCDVLTDERRRAQGNVFRTKEAAEAQAKWNKLHIALHRAAGEHQGDYWDFRFVPMWSAGDKNITTRRESEACTHDAPWFSEKSTARLITRQILGDDAEFYFTHKREVW